MRVAFVSGPYRSANGPDGILANIMAAREVGKALWRMGLVALVPHCNTFLMDGAADDSVWLAGDLELLRRCDLVVMTPGWERSSGSRAEHDEAERVGLAVLYWPDDRAILEGRAKW